VTTVNWYRRSSREFSYFGQCDRVRSDTVGEDNWQKMMANHRKISMDEFLSHCRIEELLEEDEPLEEFISADPESYFAKSIWGDQECYYIMTHGFEFIFLRS